MYVALGGESLPLDVCEGKRPTAITTDQNSVKRRHT
jgi:hypothetical protein